MSEFTDRVNKIDSIPQDVKDQVNGLIRLRDMEKVFRILADWKSKQTDREAYREIGDVIEYLKAPLPPSDLIEIKEVPPGVY